MLIKLVFPKLAKEYNYKANSLARALATKKTNIIGLIVPDITNYFFAETALYIESKLKEHGYSLILCNTADHAVEEKKYIDLLLSYGVDGLLICISHESLFDETLIKRLEKLDIACVAFDRFTENLPFPYVSIDNVHGSKLATEYLINNGHHKIGFIGGPQNVLSANKRLEGYKASLKEANIPFNNDYARIGHYQFDGGYSAGLSLLKETDVTAVFVANDMMAYGFYKAARELGRKIPEDISVIGFDDLLFSTTLDVPLTTMKQSTDELALNVCDILLKKLNKQKHPAKVILSPRLTVRNSVKKV